nr:DNA-directed DNA polymerase [Tanacetum cinerariifolium]
MGKFDKKKEEEKGKKISRAGIEVGREKIKDISKLPYPANVKSIRSFLGHAGFSRHFIKDFSKITRPITQLLIKDAKFDFSNECVEAFETLKKELTKAPILVKPDWSLPFEWMCDASDYMVLLLQEFDIKIRDNKGAENLDVDDLLCLENHVTKEFNEAEIDDRFPDESIMKMDFDLEEPWIPNFANYLAMKELPDGEERNNQLNELEELWLQAYKTFKTYKERTKKWHDNHLK